MIGYIIRIANYLDASGDEILWTTRSAVTPAGTVRPYLDRAPTISGASIGLLDPLGTSGGMVWTMTVPTMSSDARVLLRRDLVWPGTSPVPVRLREWVGSGDTSITLTQTGLTTPQIVCIGAESMRLTSETSPGVYAVDRALGSLGIAREHRWAYRTDPAPVVLLRPSDPRGMRVSVHAYDANGETLVYRGMVRGCNRTDHGLSLDIVSCIGWLRERTGGPTETVSVSGSYGQCRLDLQDRSASIVGTFRDTWAPEYARVWFGRAWIVVSVDALIESGDDVIYSFGTQAILQWGVDGSAWPQSQPPPELTELATPTRIEALRVTPLDSPSETLLDILTAQWPPGQVGGLAADDVGDLSALDGIYGEGLFRPPYSDATVWFPLPSKGAGLIDAIGAGLMVPMMAGLTSDAAGRVRALDWLRVLGGEVSVVTAELITGIGGTQDTTPVRQIGLTSVGAGGEATVRYVSDLVSRVAGIGRDVAVTPGWLQGASWLTPRFAAALQIYQLTIPTVVLTVTRAKALAIGLQPGLVLDLTCTTVWNREGGRGIVDMSGIVLSVSRRLHDSAGVYDALVGLTGFSVPLTAGNWGPSGVVQSVAGSDITLVMDDSEDADTWFSPGVAVALTDPTGLVLDGSVTVTAASGNVITVSGLGVTPAPGDRVELAVNTVAVYPDTAYLDGGQQYV